MFEIGLCENSTAPASIVIPMSTQEEAVRESEIRNRLSGWSVADGKFGWYYAPANHITRLQGAFVYNRRELEEGDVLLDPQDTSVLLFVVRRYKDSPDTLVVPLTDNELVGTEDVIRPKYDFVARCGCAFFIDSVYLSYATVPIENWPDMLESVQTWMMKLARGTIDMTEVGESQEYLDHLAKLHTLTDFHQNRSFSLDNWLAGDKVKEPTDAEPTH